MLAAYNGYEEVVWMLLEAGADVEVKSNGGRTALILAVVNDCKEVVKMLLEAGAAILVQSNDGSTALMLVARCGDKNVVVIRCGDVVASRS